MKMTLKQFVIGAAVFVGTLVLILMLTVSHGYNASYGGDDSMGFMLLSQLIFGPGAIVIVLVFLGALWIWYLNRRKMDRLRLQRRLPPPPPGAWQDPSGRWHNPYPTWRDQHPNWRDQWPPRY